MDKSEIIKRRVCMKTVNLYDNIVYKEEGITKKIIFETREALCFILNLLPGHSIPPHRHENSVLTAIVLNGACDAKVNGESTHLEKYSAFLVNGEDEFGIPVVNEALSLHVTLSPNPTQSLYSKGID